jgi:hypothetical protein
MPPCAAIPASVEVSPYCHAILRMTILRTNRARRVTFR